MKELGEIIQLVDKQSKRVIYTIWLRTFIDKKSNLFDLQHLSYTFRQGLYQSRFPNTTR